MATLTIQHTSGASGLALTYSFAAAGGDVYPNVNTQTLLVQNLSSVAVTVIITAQRACNEGTLHTQLFTIAAGATLYLGPFASQFFNDASGNVEISYSAVALTPPAAPSLPAIGSGGTWSAQTAWVKTTYVTASGETVASIVSSQPVAANGQLVITSPPALSLGGLTATGWYAYVGVGASEPADTAKYRQQAAGSPTAIGTSLTLTANPTTTGLNPPSAVALPAPAAPGVSAAGSGGTWTAQTAWVKVTQVNAQGETIASSVSSQAVGANGTLTINSPAAAGTGAGAATGWYAYVGVGASEPADTAKYRQQAAGSPTAIGANLTLTANPTTTGANPPKSNTANAVQVAVTAP